MRLVRAQSGAVFQGNGNPRVPGGVFCEFCARRCAAEVRVPCPTASEPLGEVAPRVETQRVRYLVSDDAIQDALCLHRSKIGSVQSDMTENWQGVLRAYTANLRVRDEPTGSINAVGRDQQQ